MLGLKMLLRSPEMSGPLTWRLLPWDMPFGIRLVAGGMASSSLGRTLWDKASSWRGRAAQVLWVFWCDCFMLQFFDFEEEYLFCDVTHGCTSCLDFFTMTNCKPRMKKNPTVAILAGGYWKFLEMVQKATTSELEMTIFG